MTRATDSRCRNVVLRKLPFHGAICQMVEEGGGISFFVIRVGQRWATGDPWREYDELQDLVGDEVSKILFGTQRPHCQFGVSILEAKK